MSSGEVPPTHDARAAWQAPDRGAPRYDDVAELDATWASPGGIIGWLSAVHHRTIGVRFISTALVFLCIGILLALLTRPRLAPSGTAVLSPTLVSHVIPPLGGTMLFLLIVPSALGFAVFLTPLLIGTREMAFPRLNAYAYYIYLLGGLGLVLSLVIEILRDAGWRDLPSLLADARLDVHTTVLMAVSGSAVVVAVGLVTTILKLRAPGMTLLRMPIVIWSVLVSSLLAVFALSGVIMAGLMHALDRSANTQFFAPTGGGALLLRQHLLWWFGHPQAYLGVVASLGFVSSIVTAFSRRPLFGYPVLVASLVATAIIGITLWVHQLFAAGVPELQASLVTFTGVLIAMLAVVHLICWIATIGRGRPDFRTPLLFVLGFCVAIAGSVAVSVIHRVTRAQDTAGALTQLEGMLCAGLAFPLFGAVYHWFPKVRGRRLSERLGRWHFWLLLIGFAVTVWSGRSQGWFIIAASLLMFGVNIAWSAMNGRDAGNNPWNADSLDGLVPSPPPWYNFAHLPVVSSRWPLWDEDIPGVQDALSGVRSDRREVVITTAVDASPQGLAVLAQPGLAPFLLALASGTVVAGALWNPWWVLIGGGVSLAALGWWHWPAHDGRTAPSSREARV